MNCVKVPLASDGLAGVRATDKSSAGLTVRVEDPALPPSVAVMIADPTLVPWAEPVALTTETAVSDEVQATCEVMSWVDWSE